MTNAPASRNTAPSAPASPVHASTTEYYLYEIWREQREQTAFLKAVYQKLSDISGRMLVLVLGLVILPWLVGAAIAFFSILGVGRLR